MAGEGAEEAVVKGKARVSDGFSGDEGMVEVMVVVVGVVMG